MAKLPGLQSLGPAPAADPTRPVADISGAAATVESAYKTLGKGLGEAGAGFGSLALDKSRWELGKASSYFQVGLAGLDDELKRDTNYAADKDGKTMPQRFGDKIQKLADDSRAMISYGPMRDRFDTELAPDIAKAQKSIDAHARGLENKQKVAWVAEQGDRAIDAGIKAPDQDSRDKIIQSQSRAIDGLAATGAIDPVQAYDMKRGWAKKFAATDYLHRADTDQDGVINELRAKPGSDADITNRIVSVEGAGKNAASSATGTGQFIDSTWLDVLKRNRPDLAAGRSDQELLALRADKQLGRDMTDAYRRENSAYLGKNGVEATPGNQYLAHFLGPAGAVAVAKADPTMPVADVLAKAVGPDQAKQMIEANPSILNGQLAGSVKRWADGKMGGATPGDGGLIGILPPDTREEILKHALEARHKRNADELAAFHARLTDTTAEAIDTGKTTNPLALSDFVGALGAERGPAAFKKYQGDLQLGADKAKLAGMSDGEMGALIESYSPKTGEAGYSDGVKRQAILAKAADDVKRARAEDPAFRQRLGDTTAEALDTGAAKRPLTEKEFIFALGSEQGPAAYKKYAADLKLGADKAKLPALSDKEIGDLVQSYSPKADEPNYLEGQKRQALLWKTADGLRQERDQDPAAYAVKYLPATRDAWSNFQTLASDVTKPMADRQAAARDYAIKSEMEQARVGVPADQRRVVPQDYVDRFNRMLTQPDAAGGSANVAAIIENEANLWGDRWPQVYRDIAKDAQPIVRVIGAGVKPAAAQILTETAKMPLAEILKDQDSEKSSAVKKAVLDAFKPLASSMAGNEGGIKVFNDFRGQGEKLAAYYVMKGAGADDAAAKAWDDLVGHKYAFSSDGYRVPKSTNIPLRTIESGVAAAKEKLAEFDIAPARDTIGGLTPDYLKTATARTYARDGVWVTSPDESGLALTYRDQAVRRTDGKPLVLTWQQLAAMAPGYDRSIADRAAAGFVP